MTCDWLVSGAGTFQTISPFTHSATLADQEETDGKG